MPAFCAELKIGLNHMKINLASTMLSILHKKIVANKKSISENPISPKNVILSIKNRY